MKNLTEDALLLSPSVRRERPELISAEKRGMLLSSDTEIFFDANPHNVFAITGSDGKSTVTYMTSEILRLSGCFPQVYPSGNFGTPFASLPYDDNSAYVAELSSFNLHYLYPASKRAAITSLTPNHLNWHGSMEEYVSDKLRILKFAEEYVLPTDGGVCENFAREHGAFALFSSRHSYGQLRESLPAELYITLEGGCILLNGKEILTAEDLEKIKGHNLENLMCALGLTYGYADAHCALALAMGFRGLPHRCQRVGCFGGINFIDSSIDTSPSRTATTLRTLNTPVRLILGGRGKGVPLSDAIPFIAEYAKSVHLYGECQEDFACELAQDSRTGDIPRTVSDSFTDAFNSAVRSAYPHDTVLLSPAATAYGEFRNFEERGYVFCRLAEALLKSD